MKIRLTYRLAIITLLAALLADMAYDAALFAKAQPPNEVTDFKSFLKWMRHPRGAQRISENNLVYYRITGPEGRSFASGPSAYLFNEKGELVGWTPDIGAVPIAGLRFFTNATVERVSLSSIESLLKKKAAAR